MGSWKNMGNIDKIARLIAGLVLVSLVFVGPQTPWGWLGIIPLATVVLSWCPFYTILGISTMSKANDAQEQS